MLRSPSKSTEVLPISDEKCGRFMLYQLFKEGQAHVEQHTDPDGFDLAAYDNRIAEVTQQLAHLGTYDLDEKELAYAARRAWLTAAQCPGRLPYSTLQVRDCRGAETPEDVAADLVEHLALAFNGKGHNIRPYVSVFQEGVKIANPQLLQYAGYRTTDGTVGYANNIPLTAFMKEAFGWKGEGTQFDILPWVIQTPGYKPQLFEVPASRNGRPTFSEVPIDHPSQPWLADFGLKYYSTPVVADMPLEAGGLEYPAPFNGWYVNEEVTDNFTREGRINLLQKLITAYSTHIGMDPSDRKWRRDAQGIVRTILNAAVSYSYDQAGVKMFDIYRTSEQYCRFEDRVTEASGHYPPRDPAYLRAGTDALGTDFYHKIYPADTVPLLPGEPRYRPRKSAPAFEEILAPGATTAVPRPRSSGAARCPVPHD